MTSSDRVRVGLRYTMVNWDSLALREPAGRSAVREREAEVLIGLEGGRR